MRRGAERREQGGRGRQGRRVSWRQASDLSSVAEVRRNCFDCVAESVAVPIGEYFIGRKSCYLEAWLFCLQCAGTSLI